MYRQNPLVKHCDSNDERLSPEARLERLPEKLEFAWRYTRVLPPSVRAELDADPAMQATLAGIAVGHVDLTALRCLSDGEIQQLWQSCEDE